MPCSFLSILLYNEYLISFSFLVCLLQLRHSTPLSYFQVDIFAGGVGRCTALFAGGVMLDFVTGLGSVPGRERERESEHLSLVREESLVTFSGSSLRGG